METEGEAPPLRSQPPPHVAHLLFRAPAPESPSSPPPSVELFAPPNTQQEELSSLSIDGVVTVEDCDADDDGDVDAAQLNENAIQVRELLADLLQVESAATGEKEREERLRLLLHQLRCCVLDDASLEALEQLPKRMCAYEFKPGDIAWNCRVCQVRTCGLRD